MNHIRKFSEIYHSEGLTQAIKLTVGYCCWIIDTFIHITNLKNAIRFRDHRIFFSCDIERVLPKSVRLKHPTGIVVHANTIVGNNVQIDQNVTIGKRGGEGHPGLPTIHDNVTIHAGAVVVGDVTLGKGCTIGANSVVLEDVGEGQTAVGAPATAI